MVKADELSTRSPMVRIGTNAPTAIAQLSGIAAATKRLQDAQGQGMVAEARLQALRDKGITSGPRIVAAEEAVAKARRSEASATIELAAAQDRNRVASEQGAVVATGAAGSMSRFGTAMAGTVKMAAGLGVMIGAFALVKSAISITKESAAFQRDMLLIQTQAGASAAQVRAMTPAVLALAGPLATAPEKLALSLYHAYSVTKNVAQSMDIMKIAAEGAKVGNANLEETTNALTATVASQISGVKNYSQAMGALNAIVGAGDMKLSDLNAAMSTGLMITMKNFGVSLVDVGAALATFGDNNIRGSNAATQLRMAVMALAVPARGGQKVLADLGLTSEGSAVELAKLGLKTGDLAKDLQSGGLNKAVHDLNDHLKAAGITTGETGTVLTQVFGKKAGVGLGILIGDLARFDSKQLQVRAGADKFGSAWDATTHTASFAFQKLGAEAQSAGISLAQKLLPPLTTAAVWLGTNVPGAIRTVQQTLAPLEQLVGGALKLAWSGLSAVLSTVAGVLGGLGHILSDHTAVVTAVGAAVLVMWAAYKGVAIAQAAITAISGLLTSLALKASIARSGMEGAANASSRMSLAMLGVGVVIAAAVYVWQRHAAEAAANKAAIDAYTSALEADNGALGANTRALVENNLVKAGAYKLSTDLGISQKVLTDAVLGDTNAINQVNAAMQRAKDSGGKLKGESGFLTIALGQQGVQLKAATQNAKDKAAADGKATDAIGKHTEAAKADAQTMQWTVDSSGRLVGSMGSASGAIDAATGSIKKQDTAAGLLKQSLDLLNGVAVTVEQTTNTLTDAENTFADGIAAARKAGDAGALTLDRNTRAGLKNRENLVSLIQAAKDHAQATADSVAKTEGMTAGLLAGNAQLKTDETRIRAVAAAQGLNKQQTDALIKSLGILSTIKPETTPKVKTDPAKAQIADLTAKLNAIKQNHSPQVGVNTVVGRAMIRGLQAQILALQGNTVTIDVAFKARYGPGTATYASQVPAFAPGSAAYASQVPHKATGGEIYGSGTTTSDSVPIMGSSGEFMVNAAAYARNKGLINAINSGIPWPTGQQVNTARPSGPAADPVQAAKVYAPITVHAAHLDANAMGTAVARQLAARVA